MSASKNNGLILGTTTDVHGKTVRRWMTPEEAAKAQKMGAGWREGTAAAAPTSRAAVVSSPPTPSKPFSSLAALADARTGEADDFLARVTSAFDPENRNIEETKHRFSLIEELDDLSPEARREVLSDDLPNGFAEAILSGRDPEKVSLVAQNPNVPVGTVRLRTSAHSQEAAFEALRRYRRPELEAYCSGQTRSLLWYSAADGKPRHILTGTERDADGFDAEGLNVDGFTKTGADRNGLLPDGSIAPFDEHWEALGRRTRDVSVQVAIAKNGGIRGLLENENLSTEAADEIARGAARSEDSDSARRVLNDALQTRKVSKEAMLHIIETTAKEVPQNSSQYAFADKPPRSIRILSVLHHSKSVDVGTKRKVNAVLREKGWLD